MAATTFEVHVSIDEQNLKNNYINLADQREAIIASFTASLDHWIAERRLELRGVG